MGGRRGHSTKKRSASGALLDDAAALDTSTLTTAQSVVESTTAVPAGAAGAAKKRQKREEYRASVQEEEGRGVVDLPRKKFYRQRAHANPFSDHTLDYPIGPEAMDWSDHFPAFVEQAGPAGVENSRAVTRPGKLVRNIEVADVGCGFGGLLFALAPRMPDTLILGLEIRVSVTEFVQNKIRAMRQQAAAAQPKPSSTSTANPPTSSSAEPLTVSTTNTPAPSYQNISIHRTNTMKFLPNFLPRASLHSLFLCFPDPHFKARKHKARIVSAALCSEYAFVLAPGVGRVYTITDVRDLHEWMCERFDAHPAFRRLSGGEEQADWKVGVMMGETEEGRKVERNGGEKFVACWERGWDLPWVGEEDG